jgi:aspartate racemase
MQKTIGLIGGMSWESSAVYYKIINQEVQQKLGGVHSCKSLMYSVDFDEIAALQRAGDWNKLETILCNAAQRLEKGGADFILICANTMHKLADATANSVSIPLIHIADATAEVIKKEGFKKVGLLGTKFTMEENFLRGRFLDNHNLQTIVPDKAQREIIHNIIYDELTKGVFTTQSKQEYIKIINDLISQGAEGIVLGCTEIRLLITPNDTQHTLFDTAEIHAKKAVELALENSF